MGIFVDRFNIDCLLEMFTGWWWVESDSFILEVEKFFAIVGLRGKKCSPTSKSQWCCFELKH